MNFIFTRRNGTRGNSEAPLFASNLFSFYYPCQPTTNWNWKSSWREYNELRIDFQGRCFLYEVFLPSRGFSFTWNSSWYPKIWCRIFHHLAELYRSKNLSCNSERRQGDKKLLGNLGNFYRSDKKLFCDYLFNVFEYYLIFSDPVPNFE